MHNALNDSGSHKALLSYALNVQGLTQCPALLCTQCTMHELICALCVGMCGVQVRPRWRRRLPATGLRVGDLRPQIAIAALHIHDPQARPPPRPHARDGLRHLTHPRGAVE